MECNKADAIRAKEIAEKKFMENDMGGAKKFAMKAQKLFPQLDGVTQFIEVIDVHVALANKMNGEPDWYGIFGMDPLSTDDAIKKQYKRKALILHPDKNKSKGADSAFMTLLDAWQVLSDKDKRREYDFKINVQIPDQSVPTKNLETPPANTSAAFHDSSTPRAENMETPASNPSAVHKLFVFHDFFNSSSTLRAEDLERVANNPSASHNLFDSHSSPNLEADVNGPGFHDFGSSFSTPEFPWTAGYATNQTAIYNNIPTARTRSQNVPPPGPQKKSDPIVYPRPEPRETFWTSCCWCNFYYEQKQCFVLNQVMCCNCRKWYIARDVPVTDQIVRNARRVNARHLSRGRPSRSSGSGSVPMSDTRTNQSATAGTPSGDGVNTGQDEATTKRKRAVPFVDMQQMWWA